MSVQCSTARPLASRRPSHEQEERYTKDKLIGAGTYGKVYRGKDLRENRPVALKDIRLDSDELGMPSTALREIALLRDLEHPNIIKYASDTSVLRKSAAQAVQGVAPRKGAKACTT